MWSRFTDYEGEFPPTHQEFMKRKIYGDYTTLDLKGILMLGLKNIQMLPWLLINLMTLSLLQVLLLTKTG